MTLSRKFIFALLFSIFLIAIVNILSFYFLYTNFLENYLTEKSKNKSEITEQYILELLEKQAQDEVDDVFSDLKSDASLEFFELLEKSGKAIPLDKKENKDIVTKYLIKSGISPKYIEEVIPDDNLKNILSSIKDENSLEYKFLNNLTYSILIINIFLILFLIWAIWFFTRRTITPINKITNKIKNLKLGENLKKIEYKKNDEIWLLIKAINGLNSKLAIQEKIRNRLLADISHELKTPITSISCYLEWIQDWVIKLDNETLWNITEDMQRLIKLVNMIMKYEKFDNRTLKIEKHNRDLKILTQKVVSQYENNLLQNSQNIRIIWEIIKQVDRNLFKQIVHNVIWNFLKYAWKNSNLDIIFTQEYIIFKDDWEWIDRREVPMLKEKFYQAKIEKTGKIEDRWIWVGLSIISKIIERHGWRFEIISDSWKGFILKIIF